MPHLLLTPRALAALKKADDFAAACGQRPALSEHLIIALFRVRNCLAAEVLTNLDVDPRDILYFFFRSRLEACHARSNCLNRPTPTVPAPSPTVDIDEVLELAHQESLTLEHSHVGTEHLLLAMLHAAQCRVARALSALNVSYTHALAEVRATVAEGVSTHLRPGLARRLLSNSEAESRRHAPFAPHPRPTLGLGHDTRIILTDSDAISAVRGQETAPEHILLAMLYDTEHPSLPALLLRRRGLTYVSLHSQLQAMGNEQPAAPRNPSAELDQLFKHAARTARWENQPALNPESLLLAMLSFTDSLAVRAITSLGIDPITLELDLLHLMSRR